MAWWASTLALAGLVAALGVATADELRRLLRVVPPTPPEVGRDVIVRNVADRHGRRASFRILLFTDEFRWRLSSHEAIDAQQPRPHFTDEMKTVLADAREIICVGASSEELPAGVPFDVGRAAEERRAALRAERIALWVRESLSRPVPIRKLNVGYHAPTGRAVDTADQRRVIIILVLDAEDRVDIDQALRAAMARESIRAPIFEALLTRYSLSGGDSFVWVP